MVYLKSLFVNFLIVFLTSHILQGVDVVNTTKLPHPGSDLIFALVLGLLISVIYPLLKLRKCSLLVLRMALISLVIAFGSYGLLKLFPLGITISSLHGYLAASALVAVGSFATNYWEYRKDLSHVPPPPEEPPSFPEL